MNLFLTQGINNFDNIPSISLPIHSSNLTNFWSSAADSGSLPNFNYLCSSQNCRLLRQTLLCTIEKWWKIPFLASNQAKNAWKVVFAQSKDFKVVLQSRKINISTIKESYLSFRLLWRSFNWNNRVKLSIKPIRTGDKSLLFQIFA